MQELALAEGALPRHMHTALFTSSTDNRLLTHRYNIFSLYLYMLYLYCRQLSRHLIKLWITENPTANALLLRMLVGHTH